MYYYLELDGNKVTGKGYTSVEISLQSNQMSITEEQYNSIRLPAEIIDGEIISAPEPPEFTNSAEVDRKVVEMIREQYDINEEFKMLRLGTLDSENSEFILYKEYVEQCRLWGKNKKIELGLEV